MRAQAAAKLLMLCEHNLGVVAGATSQSKAMDVTWYRPRAAKVTAVGVLIGMDEPPCVAGEPVWLRHVACSQAFATANSTTSRTRSAEGSKKQSMQERLGFFSFGQGDAVCYTPLECGDPVVDISVFGVIYKDANSAEQGRKYLVLYEMKTETFFIGSWTHYARRCKKGIAQNNANASKDSLVCTMSNEAKERMLAQFDESMELRQLSLSLLKKRSEEPPPSIKFERAEAKKLAKKKEAEAARKQKEAEKNADNKTQPVLAPRPPAPKPSTSKQTSRGDKRQEHSLSEAPYPWGGEANEDNGAFVFEDEIPPPPRDRHRTSSRLGVEVSRQAEANLAQSSRLEAMEAQLNELIKSVKNSHAPLPIASPPCKHVNHSCVPLGWKQSIDGDGVTYYYNKMLGRSQYEEPTEDSPPLPPPVKTQQLRHDKVEVPQHSEQIRANPIPTNQYHYRQRMREIARLRGMLPHLQGYDKASMAGDLAALEADMGFD